MGGTERFRLMQLAKADAPFCTKNGARKARPPSRQLAPLAHIAEALLAWPGSMQLRSPAGKPAVRAEVLQQGGMGLGSPPSHCHKTSVRCLVFPKPGQATQLSVRHLTGLESAVPVSFAGAQAQARRQTALLDEGELLLEGPAVLVGGGPELIPTPSRRSQRSKRIKQAVRAFPVREGLVERRAQKQRQLDRPKQRGGVLEQLLSGAFAGVVSRSAVAPLDLIRTHLITRHVSVHTGKNAAQVAAHILQQDGWQGLFRGNGINCLRVAPNKAIELCVFESLKRWIGGEGHPLQRVAAPLAGGAAGMAGTLATYPLELMRTRMSVQPQLYSGIRATFHRIVREEGAGALYRGLTPSLLGVFPYAATNYFVYDALRGAYRRATGEDNVPTGPTLCFGAMAAAASSAVTFPLEVARRQLQMGGPAAQGSFLRVVGSIYRHEGLCAIYRGLGTTWLKLVPAAGISFVCYEAARVALRVDDASFVRAAREAEAERERAEAVPVRMEGREREGRREPGGEEQGQADCPWVEVPTRQGG